jgi:chromosome segregation ATPase
MHRGDRFYSMLSENSTYEYQLRIIDAEIQAAERKHESGSRAREELDTEIRSIGAELTESHSAMRECRAKLTEDQNDSEDILQEIQRELKCHQAKEKQLMKDFERLCWQSQELMCSLGELNLTRTWGDLIVKRSRMQYQMRLDMQHNQGIIPGLLWHSNNYYRK